MKKSKKNLDESVCVTFDTSAVYTRNAREPVSLEFQKFVDEFAQQPSTKIFVPELVVREIIHHKSLCTAEVIEKITTNLRSIRDYTGRSYQCPARKHVLDTTLKYRVTQFFDHLKAITVPTPYSEISVKDIEDLALAGEPPFGKYEPDNKHVDNGIKDYLILQTILHIRKRHDVHRLVMAVSDGRLSQALHREFENDEDVIIYDTINECSAYLRFTIEQFSKAKTRAILENASKRFFHKPSKTGLYFEAGVSESIAGQYEQEMKALRTSDINIPEVESFVPDGAGRFKIGRTMYVTKDEHRYRFSSPIRYLRRFTREYDLPGNVQKIGEIELELRFSVVWSARIGRDGRFLDKRFEELSLDVRIAKPVSNVLYLWSLMESTPVPGSRILKSFLDPKNPSAIQDDDALP